MSFKDKITGVAGRLDHVRGRDGLGEEATKTALVLPFLAALGYDVFNPGEVQPEYTADVGVKKGEKVDYAIFLNEQVEIIIEAKPISCDLAKAQYS